MPIPVLSVDPAGFLGNALVPPSKRGNVLYATKVPATTGRAAGDLFAVVMNQAGDVGNAWLPGPPDVATRVVALGFFKEIDPEGGFDSQFIRFSHEIRWKTVSSLESGSTTEDALAVFMAPLSSGKEELRELHEYGLFAARRAVVRGTSRLFLSDHELGESVSGPVLPLGWDRVLLEAIETATQENRPHVGILVGWDEGNLVPQPVACDADDDDTLAKYLAGLLSSPSASQWLVLAAVEPSKHDVFGRGLEAEKLGHSLREQEQLADRDFDNVDRRTTFTGIPTRVLELSATKKDPDRRSGRFQLTAPRRISLDVLFMPSLPHLLFALPLVVGAIIKPAARIADDARGSEDDATGSKDALRVHAERVDEPNLKRAPRELFNDAADAKRTFNARAYKLTRLLEQRDAAVEQLRKSVERIAPDTPSVLLASAERRNADLREVQEDAAELAALADSLFAVVAALTNIEVLERADTERARADAERKRTERLLAGVTIAGAVLLGPQLVTGFFGTNGINWSGSPWGLGAVMMATVLVLLVGLFFVARKVAGQAAE